MSQTPSKYLPGGIPIPPAIPHIFVGTPAHDTRWHSRYGTALIKLFDFANRLPKEKKFGITMSTVSGGGITKARNNLSWEFLEKTKASHIFWVDSDISFEPQDVMRLLSHDLDIVGGLYCHKKRQVFWSCKAIPGEEMDPKTGLQKVAAIGTGFLCVKREVFLKMRDSWPEIRYVEDWEDGKGKDRWGFFREGVVHDPEMGIADPLWLTEDWYFCYLARKLGFTIHADAGILVKHWEGMTSYPLPEAIEPLQKEIPAEQPASAAA